MRVKRIHRHKVDPDLSALISAPACGCGSFVWSQHGDA